MSDEWEPFIGDGNTWVSMRGSDDAFDGRYMSYSEYSVCTWFYLNQLQDNGNLYLIVMTATEENITSTHRNQAPALFIKNSDLNA